MAYTPYYSGGWQTGEEGGTPITPAALNHMEAGIEASASSVTALQSQAVDSDGNIDTDLSLADYVVLAARCGQCLCTPWANTTTNTWWIHVTNYDGAPLAGGTNLRPVYVYYLGE